MVVLYYYCQEVTVIALILTGDRRSVKKNWGCQ